MKLSSISPANRSLENTGVLLVSLGGSQYRRSMETPSGPFRLPQKADTAEKLGRMHELTEVLCVRGLLPEMPQ